jgi:hypothetical protein
MWRFMSITKQEWQVVAELLGMKGDDLRKKCTSVISAAGGKGFVKNRSFTVSIKEGKIVFPSLVNSGFWSVDPIAWTAKYQSYPQGIPAGLRAGRNETGHRLPASSCGYRYK